VTASVLVSPVSFASALASSSVSSLRMFNGIGSLRKGELLRSSIAPARHSGIRDLGGSPTAANGTSNAGGFARDLRYSIGVIPLVSKRYEGVLDVE
jgi:hypothetical protein